MAPLSSLAGAEASSGESRIDSLLTGGGTEETTVSPAGGNGTTVVAEDTSVADADTVSDEEEAGVATDEGSEEEPAGEEDEGGETGDLEITEDDRDFSPDTYKRAAEHYSKQAGKTLDPNDPGDRFLLRELMQRGQKIKELQSQPEEEEEEPAASATEEAAAPRVPEKLTTEQIMERVANAEAYAKANIIPEVSMKMANEFVAALWFGKKDLPQITSQEHANAINQFFGKWGAMLVADAIPAIMSAVPQAVTADPMFGRVRDLAMRESAADAIMGAMDAKGNPEYPDFEKFVDNGSIKKAMNSLELKDAVFSKDPQKNLVAKLKMAYKLVRNQPIETEALAKAVKRGREVERERATRVAAGKLPPGSSRGSFTEPRRAENFITSLVDNSGGKFSRLLADAKK